MKSKECDAKFWFDNSPSIISVRSTVITVFEGFWKGKYEDAFSF
jgi:hypothetical protein